jgi:hypothetical protein
VYVYVYVCVCVRVCRVSASSLQLAQGMAAHKAKPLFAYHPGFRFGSGDPSLDFVEQVCIRLGCDGMPPENPLLEKPIYILSTPSETERLMSWLCHAWHMQLDPQVGWRCSHHRVAVWRDMTRPCPRLHTRIHYCDGVSGLLGLLSCIRVHAGLSSYVHDRDATASSPSAHAVVSMPLLRCRWSPRPSSRACATSSCCTR